MTLDRWPVVGLIAFALGLGGACERRPSAASCDELSANVHERLERGGECQLPADCVFSPRLPPPGQRGGPSERSGTATDRSTAQAVSVMVSDYAAKGCGAVLDARRDQGQELLPDCVNQTCRLRAVSGY